jgi:hypothetical protein
MVPAAPPPMITTSERFFSTAQFRTKFRDLALIIFPITLSDKKGLWNNDYSHPFADIFLGKNVFAFATAPFRWHARCKKGRVNFSGQLDRIDGGIDMVRLLMFSVLGLASVPALAQVPNNIYVGVDTSGKSCQLEIVKFQEVQDPTVNLPENFEDNLQYTNVKRFMDVKVHFDTDEAATIQSTYAPWAQAYTTYALSGWTDLSGTKKIQLKLGMAGEGPQEMRLVLVGPAGQGARVQRCMNLTPKKS